MELADGAITLLGDDDFGTAFEVGIVLLVDFFAEDKHNNVGVLLDGAGFAQIGGGWSPPRLSGARLSCDKARTGTWSSLAMAFRPREIEETSWVRFSKRLLPPDMSCR